MKLREHKKYVWEWEFANLCLNEGNRWSRARLVINKILTQLNQVISTHRDACEFFLSLRDEVFDVVDRVESLRANVIASWTPQRTKDSGRMAILSMQIVHQVRICICVHIN